LPNEKFNDGTEERLSHMEYRQTQNEKPIQENKNPTTMKLRKRGEKGGLTTPRWFQTDVGEKN
jgi:hypothetical protein